MCVYVGMYVCMNTSVCMYVCMYTLAYMSVCIYTYNDTRSTWDVDSAIKCVCTSISLYLYVCIFVRMWMYVCMYTCTCLHVCPHVCMYVSMYMYNDTHSAWDVDIALAKIQKPEWSNLHGFEICRHSSNGTKLLLHVTTATINQMNGAWTHTSLYLCVCICLCVYTCMYTCTCIIIHVVPGI